MVCAVQKYFFGSKNVGRKVFYARTCTRPKYEAHLAACRSAVNRLNCPTRSVYQFSRKIRFADKNIFVFFPFMSSKTTSGLGVPYLHTKGFHFLLHYEIHFRLHSERLFRVARMKHHAIDSDDQLCSLHTHTCLCKSQNVKLWWWENMRWKS